MRRQFLAEKFEIHHSVLPAKQHLSEMSCYFSRTPFNNTLDGVPLPGGEYEDLAIFDASPAANVPHGFGLFSNPLSKVPERNVNA